MWWILCCFTQIVVYGVKASECTLPSVEDICVYGNDKSFIPDGAAFEFFIYDSTTRANVYFCEECWGAYLFVCIDEPTKDYYWVIGDDYQSCEIWSSCYAGNSLGLNYLNINSCFNVGNWATYNGIESQWDNDIDMSLSVCNPICYETDICPQTTLTNIQTTKTVERINIKIDKSTSWNGDLYFDFGISEEDCMNPQLSFEYELIDYDDIYENIKIYDDNDILIATCNGGQSCGTFDSCLIDYDIDDIIPVDETYSIMIHQTADINNLCGNYILNAVLTLTCITDNIINTTSIVSSTLENQCGNREYTSTTWFTSTVSRSSTLSTKTSKLTKKNNISTWSVVGGVGITIVFIIAWCMYKKMKREVIGMAQEKKREVIDKYVKKQGQKGSMVTIPTILIVKTTVVKTT